MNGAIESSLMDYGRALMTQVTGVKLGIDQTPDHWSAWTKYLFTAEKLSRRALESVGSLVRLDARAPDQITYVPLCALGLGPPGSRSWLLNPTAEQQDFASLSRTLGEMFQQHGGQQETNFDRFYGLMQSHASTLPCTYGEKGVSLFRQWALVAALMSIAGSTDGADLPETLALIGIDFPGIQTMVYTIASRNAGKGVRGRSAFVQLLVNALVDRVITTLDLCQANIIVNAGGNALILAGWRADLAEQLQRIAIELDRILLNGDNHRLHFAGFQGDLALALAHLPLPRQALFYPSVTRTTTDGKSISLWQEHESRLKEELQQAKQQPFAALLAQAEPALEDGFALFFRPDPVLSDRFCNVCQRPEQPGEEFEFQAAEETLVCPECGSFRRLAETLAKEGDYLHRGQEEPVKVEVWQEILHAISGFWYDFVEQPPKHGRTWALSLQNFPHPNAHGFRLMATTTPLTDEGQILDNSELAAKSNSAFERIGVLKADVDNLGQLLFEGLDLRSAALTATLSETMTLFFGGWLDAICQSSAYANSVYVLYAGGDDLLILGTWEVMPLLARQIAQDFRTYMGDNPAIHLSAGISLVGAKEPLHAAIDQADKTLAAAKQFNQRTKNAIGFLGHTWSWEQFEAVVEWQETLTRLATAGELSSLTMRLQAIYQQYRRDLGLVHGFTRRAREGDYHGVRLHMGPWLWKLVYNLQRVAGRDASAATTAQLAQIQQKLLQRGAMEAMGTGARWSELLTRAKGKEK